MNDETVCSARPSDLIEYARETGDAVWQLRSALHDFDLAVETYELVTGGIFRLARYADALWESAFELEDMAGWVGHVGWAFAVAGAGGDATTTTMVSASVSAVDHWLDPADWNPAKHLRTGAPGEWLQMLDPRCRGFTDAGYRGDGFVVGPDGRTYPLVAPYVVRDGVEYHADDGLAPGQRSVLDLDGRDPGWTTIDERIGVERWGTDAPDIVSRVATAVGATVAGRPNGSSRSDVEALTVTPGRAPVWGAVPDRPSTEPAPPPYMQPSAPPYSPPAQPDTVYPDAAPRAGKANAISSGVDLAAGFFMADLGRHAAYDITFQQNASGQVRALYKRIYVGFDDDGAPCAESVWVTGPQNNDHVLINYAP